MRRGDTCADRVRDHTQRLGRSRVPGRTADDDPFRRHRRRARRRAGGARASTRVRRISRVTVAHLLSRRVPTHSAMCGAPPGHLGRGHGHADRLGRRWSRHRPWGRTQLHLRRRLRRADGPVGSSHPDRRPRRPRPGPGRRHRRRGARGTDRVRAGHPGGHRRSGRVRPRHARRRRIPHAERRTHRRPSRRGRTRPARRRGGPARRGQHGHRGRPVAGGARMCPELRRGHRGGTAHGGAGPGAHRPCGGRTRCAGRLLRGRAHTPPTLDDGRGPRVRHR